MAQTTNEIDRGATLVSWKFPEVPQYNRGRQWYIGMSVFGLAVIAWSVYDRNFLFGVIIVLALAIIFFQSRQNVRTLQAEITEEGVAVGRDFFSYDDIRTFWIIYRPKQIQKVYLSFKSALRPTLDIPLADADPVKVRKELLRFVTEDLEKDEISASDAFGKLFKV